MGDRTTIGSLGGEASQEVGEQVLVSSVRSMCLWMCSSKKWSTSKKEDKDHQQQSKDHAVAEIMQVQGAT